MPRPDLFLTLPTRVSELPYSNSSIMHGNLSHFSPESWARLNKIRARTIGNSRPSTKLQSISDISWRVERLEWSLITSRLFMPLHSARKKLSPASNINFHTFLNSLQPLNMCPDLKTWLLTHYHGLTSSWTQTI